MRDFLSALWTPAAAYGELRLIKRNPGNPKPYIGQEFFRLDGTDPYQWADDTARDADMRGFDVYFGVLRRKTRSGTAADVVDRAPVLWADIDPYKPHPSADCGGDERECRQGLDTVLSFPLPPSIIVDSGHGLHAYWLLRDAAPVADASLAMKGIAKAIGGDHTHDPARVLRLPGTHNHKNGNSVPVRLLRLDTTKRYRFSDFSEYVDAAIGPRPGTPHSWAARSDEPPPDGSIPGWLETLIRDGMPKGQRSEACFKVCVWLLRFGYSAAAIRGVFYNNPQGIGAKYWELWPATDNLNTAGERWLDRTIRAAESAV